MSKTFLLDTNVLLQDNKAIFNFQEHTIIIPIGVIEELDTFKKETDSRGRNARKASRQIDELRKNGDLRKGCNLPNGGKLIVGFGKNINSFEKEKNVDYHILQVAQEWNKIKGNEPCTIVSNDVNVRIMANAYGLLTEEYEANKVELDLIDNGLDEIEVDFDLVDVLTKENELEVSVDDYEFAKYGPNHYFNLRCSSQNRSVLAKLSSDKTTLTKVYNLPGNFPLTPKNIEQKCVLDALMDDKISLVAISGHAGTGKSILGTSAGYYQTIIKERYEKFLVSRPVFPMGKDIGYLPGSATEKMDPWMTPIYDAFDVILLLDKDKKNKSKKSSPFTSGKKLIEASEQIKIEPLTYIRGRSIHRQFFLIDETQNVNALEIKTILTRAGEGTKIVITGDVDQIDNPYVDKQTNGLSVVMNAFKDSSLAAHIVMKHGVRSALSEEASNRL